MNAADHPRTPADLEWSERNEGQRTEYTVAPSRMGALPYLVGAGLWDSFLIFFFVGAARGEHPDRSVPFLLLPIVHGLIGAFVTWLALVKTLNRTRLTIDPEALVLSHHPIPARGARFATHGVTRFHVDAEKGSESARIQMQFQDGKATVLPLPFDQRDAIGFVASKLNAALARTRNARKEE